MQGALRNAGLARIPASALTSLHRLRARANVTVRLDSEFAWVRWDEAGFETLRELLPARGAQFFEQIDQRWHLCGQSLPYFDVPADGFQPLASVLSPGKAALIAPDDETLPRVVVALKRSTEPRAASALLVNVKALAVWADMALASEIAGLAASVSGELALIAGRNLPNISAAERYWGERLLCPLGWAPDPALPESALLEALGISADEIALMRKAVIEVIPRAAFRPLTRAGLRLGARA